MVAAFVLPPLFAAQLNKYFAYNLFCLVPRTYIGRALPFGRIWYQRKLQRWGTTLTVPGGTAWLEIRVRNQPLGVMYVEEKVALKLHWHNSACNEREDRS